MASAYTKPNFTASAVRPSSRMRHLTRHARNRTSCARSTSLASSRRGLSSYELRRASLVSGGNEAAARMPTGCSPKPRNGSPMASRQAMCETRVTCCKGSHDAQANLLVRGGRRRFSHLEDLRTHSFLHPRVADPEEAEAVGAIGVRAGLEGAADLVDPKRIVEDFYSFRRVYVDGLVLPDRHLAAVVAHRGDATQEESRPGRYFSVFLRVTCLASSSVSMAQPAPQLFQPIGECHAREES